MAGRYNEAQAASDTRLFSCRDFLDLGAVLLDPMREGAEIGIGLAVVSVISSCCEARRSA
jgi:hypothetical protein